MRRHMIGIAMIEIVLSLLLLTLAMLGMVSLQLQAVARSQFALQQLQASNVLQDLSERLRVNALARQDYVKHLDGDAPSAVQSCLYRDRPQGCSAAEMAAYDAYSLYQRAQQAAMQLALRPCANTTQRLCAYAAWGETKALDDLQDPLACSRQGIYLPKAQCLMMTLY
ncbi:type IV pilus modification protein PilV [Acinetobacter larvae]|uniref:Type IV pilus modification protein PilV n=1 Tax=Acinetobacter larvae TaxID=1789224 RepID=A0A1B2LW17_9GAMM|nr:type IV pilus modification protein PilV [Acinetobacter larvae]AOA57141.1 type IV pilus modification protein PilV [Acinetobacter larvae]